MTEQQKLIKVRVYIIMLAMSLLLAAYSYRTAKAQDGSWVDKLRNQSENVCCYDNDGRRLTDPEWDTHGIVQAEREGTSGYRVKDNGEWRDVANWAVVTMKNYDGIPRVWYSHSAGGKRMIHCFLRGNLG